MFLGGGKEGLNLCLRWNAWVGVSGEQERGFCTFVGPFHDREKPLCDN